MKHICFICFYLTHNCFTHFILKICPIFYNSCGRQTGRQTSKAFGPWPCNLRQIRYIPKDLETIDFLSNLTKSSKHLNDRVWLCQQPLHRIVTINTGGRSKHDWQSSCYKQISKCFPTNCSFLVHIYFVCIFLSSTRTLSTSWNYSLYIWWSVNFQVFIFYP